MPLRLLARAAPLVLAALGVAIWRRRREVAPPALPPGPVSPPGPPSGRFVGPAPAPSGRFARRPVDIVSVVDDLLPARE